MTAAAPVRTVYPCQRCGQRVDARQMHVTTYRSIEREHITPGGRRTVEVATYDQVGVTHLAPCTPVPVQRSAADADQI